jgi:DNA-binding NarL/FixJ family response regulator
MKTTRILIADDHEVVREGLRALLDRVPNLRVCGEAASSREAVAKARALRPDVVIMDFSLSALNGLEATRQIRRALPKTEVLMLATYGSETLARQLLAAGACGYVFKSDAKRHLLAAVDALAQHLPYFTPRVAGFVLQRLTDEHAEPPPAAEQPADTLTPREREVVQLVAEGRTSKEIAAALGVSAKTVETHRTNIMNKLQLRCAADVVRYAIRNGIVEP